jgi:hypothetical protein
MLFFSVLVTDAQDDDHDMKTRSITYENSCPVTGPSEQHCEMQTFELDLSE